jgi:hypothetical protein
LWFVAQFEHFGGIFPTVQHVIVIKFDPVEGYAHDSETRADPHAMCAHDFEQQLGLGGTATTEPPTLDTSGDEMSSVHHSTTDIAHDYYHRQ